jgi:hypothetical protein
MMSIIKSDCPSVNISMKKSETDVRVFIKRVLIYN